MSEPLEKPLNRLFKFLSLIASMIIPIIDLVIVFDKSDFTFIGIIKIIISIRLLYIFFFTTILEALPFEIIIQILIFIKELYSFGLDGLNQIKLFLYIANISIILIFVIYMICCR